MSDSQNRKNKRRCIALILSITFLVSGCSNKVDSNLWSSCAKLKDNLDVLYAKSQGFEKLFNQKINQFQSLGAGWNTESRKEMISYVNDNFPFFAQFLNENFYNKYLERKSDGMYKYPLENLISYVLLVEALKDTDFKLDVSRAQLDSIENETETSYAANTAFINSELNRIMGRIDSNESGIAGNSGCSLVTAARYKTERDQADGKLFQPLEEFLLHVDPRTIFVMRAEGAFKTIFFNMSDLISCDVKGETEEYKAIGDGTPGIYTMTKCRI